MQDYEQLLQESNDIIKDLNDRIKWLETANDFHKKAAEDAQQEQWRLQKKVYELENDYMAVQAELQTKNNAKK